MVKFEQYFTINFAFISPLLHVLMSKKKYTDEVYVVEAVVGHKKGKKRDKYQVKWVGYDEPTWEPVELLDNCRDLIIEYWKDQKTKAKQSSDISKPKDPPDFREYFKLPFSSKEKEHLTRKIKTNRDLIPWPNTNDESEPQETSFFDLQIPPNLYFIERNQNPKWELCGREVFNENPTLDKENMPIYTICDIFKNSNETFVKVKDKDGNTEDIPYDIFYSLFPNSVYEYFNNLIPLYKPE
ncbi:hypothetical protein TRFO_06413 [Tritrichomonas foetus]|uniref:Chromo domain-containing protein n=1 Tax=Tritrichomonas foetus TaxID=1144522 RepID=A0A1J4K306_9EUKA|nr:hypothetical protein TRFO_06413 [Tritrichomonas foetus]|eukprot:OHT04110.1 hypothetical protein TRFO_06413 [Tritrichomonas foetus]